MIFLSIFLKSCSERKVEVDVSVYGPADCGTSSQTMDNKTELKIWAFEKKGHCSAEGSITINFKDPDNLTSIHLLSIFIPRSGQDIQKLEIERNCSAFTLSQQDFKASKYIIGVKGK
jgi:hypothetical protein